MSISVPPVGMESQPDRRQPLTHVAFAGQASRASLDQLENRTLSAEVARYLAYALAIPADAEAKVVHIDSVGVEHIFTALPGDEVPTGWDLRGPGVVIGLERAITAHFTPFSPVPFV